MRLRRGYLTEIMGIICALAAFDSVAGEQCRTQTAAFSATIEEHRIGEKSRLSFSFNGVMSGWSVVTFLIDDFVAQHVGQSETVLKGEDSLKFAVKLSFEEIASNAVKRGNKSDPTKLVKVRAEANARTIAIEIEDEGDGIPEVVPHAARPGQAGALDHQAGDRAADSNGFGSLLAGAMTDSLHVNSTPQGTTVRLTWDLVNGRHTER